MKFAEYTYLIRCDLRRYNKESGHFFKTYFTVSGFHYTFWLRTTRYLKKLKFLYIFYVFSRLRLHRLQLKYGISIPYNTQIGPGLYIGHNGGIVVNNHAIIGKNCNINHGVTIGTTYGGSCPGTPKIGDRVYLGPGSFIIGGITLGDDVAIGANTVVNKSVPPKGVVVNPSGKIVSYKGSENYIVNINC